MIGIIIWIILIIIIAESVSPGLIWVVLGCLLICGVIYFLVGYLVDKIRDKKNPWQNQEESTRNQKDISNQSKTSDIPVASNAIISNSNPEQSALELRTVVPLTKIDIKGVWDEERTKIKKGFDLENILIDGIRHKVAITKEVTDTGYVVAKLMKSIYPFSWNRHVESEIRGDILLINYWMPTFDDMPDFIEVEYKNEQPVCVSPNEKRLKEVWTEMSYKIVVRSLYELFSSIQLNNIESVSFNGIIRSLDLATGNESEKCIMSVIVKRSDFEKLDLSRVDAKQCFRRFKGVSAHDLSALTPIPPLMTMNKIDKRFSDSYDVMSNIEIGENLAAMDWRDFENLIRDIFEKEFSADGSEVKITRASKDGGVDAVVFDSDPIRGGKIIIQAKRYTNVVGVSAVRDLYGTVMNEGATKGILVTTSDYGADSYNFAKDKPITLLNGANLLHLLGKHGCKARINILEAKKLLNSTEDE